MSIKHPQRRAQVFDPSRREFLRRSQALGLAGAAAPWAMSLAAIGEAAAASTTAPTDYKALVCVFMYGGNDYANTLVPYDAASHAAYQAIRISQASGGIAIDKATLDAAGTVLTPGVALADGHQYALAPEMLPLKTLFDAGHMGVLLNIGTLVQPTTLAQYKSGNTPLPPKLFSHNDQQSYWQSSNPEGATSGWGGRVGDLFAAGNGKATFTCVNVSGNAVYLSGSHTAAYQVSPAGAAALQASTRLYGSTAAAQVLRDLITQGSPHKLEADYAAITVRALDANTTLGAAVKDVALTTTFDTTNPLAMQMQMVAKMIAARSTLGATRQVFFVSLGGFDHHDFLLAQHPKLIGQVASAMSSFYSATAELGVADQVTAFTASDFGRTLSSNGDGSDHGWGSHHFVVGGAVKGGRYFGTPPATSVTSDDQVGQGRLLPSTSVDQLAATLARWMGVASDSDLRLVVPNIGNYNASTWDIGLFG